MDRHVANFIKDAQFEVMLCVGQDVPTELIDLINAWQSKVKITLQECVKAGLLPAAIAGNEGESDGEDHIRQYIFDSIVHESYAELEQTLEILNNQTENIGLVCVANDSVFLTALIFYLDPSSKKVCQKYIDRLSDGYWKYALILVTHVLTDKKYGWSKKVPKAFETFKYVINLEYDKQSITARPSFIDLTKLSDYAHEKSDIFFCFLVPFLRRMRGFSDFKSMDIKKYCPDLSESAQPVALFNIQTKDNRLGVCYFDSCGKTPVLELLKRDRTLKSEPIEELIKRISEVKL